MSKVYFNEEFFDLEFDFGIYLESKEEIYY